MNVFKKVKFLSNTNNELSVGNSKIIFRWSEENKFLDVKARNISS
jgi:hypothetical protein